MKYVILDEYEIGWELQNKIHRLLNTAYQNSKTFISKTYAHQKPRFRVLAFDAKDELVGMHAAFFPIRIITKSKEITTAGIGLYCVKKSSGLSKVAVDIYANLVKELAIRGVDAALTITKDPVVERISKKVFNASEFDVPVRGQGGYTKRDDKVILLNISETKINASYDELSSVLKESEELLIEGGLF